VTNAPKRLIEEMSGLSFEQPGEVVNWGDCLLKVYDQIYEMALVGAGIGGGFTHSSELNVLNYNKAMKSTDMDVLAKWIQGMDEEHARFLLNDVWVAVLKGDFANVIPITMTWALKLKASGVVRARCNVRGFEQLPKIHYDPSAISSPVTTQAAIFVAFTILTMNKEYEARIIDVKGAFLKGKFASQDETLLLEVPQGFRWVYDKLGDEVEARSRAGNKMKDEEVMKRAQEIFQEWVVKPNGENVFLLKKQLNIRQGSKKVYLRMQRTIYGCVQAARAFWMELQKAFQAMGYTRSVADPCLYVRWDEDGEMCAWLTWIDDCIVIGKADVVARESAKLMSLFECEDVGPMVEYIGNKIKMKEGKMKLTQPVLLKSFVDEFAVDAQTKTILPAKPSQILKSSEEKDWVSDWKATKFRSGVGKLRYLATWSRPDILNAVREVSRQLKHPNEEHYQAMLHLMQFCVATASRGRLLSPNDKWNGDKAFEFIVSGRSDSNFNCTETRKSVSGNTTEVNGVPVLVKSVMQETIKLSVTEAELDSATSNVQDMLIVKQIIESMGLHVKIPMVLYSDNRGVKELVDNWSVGGRMRHIATKTMFLRELKEWGVLVIEYIPGTDMCTDLLTKNLPKPLFEKHSKHYVSDEEFGIEDGAESQQARESVGIENCSTNQKCAGGTNEVAGAQRKCRERQDGVSKQGETRDPLIGRPQQLGNGDGEAAEGRADHDGLKEKGVGDGDVVGTDVQRLMQRDRREKIVKELQLNG
jgi:hypothetical protein